MSITDNWLAHNAVHQNFHVWPSRPTLQVLTISRPENDNKSVGLHSSYNTPGKSPYLFQSNGVSVNQSILGILSPIYLN